MLRSFALKVPIDFREKVHIIKLNKEKKLINMNQIFLNLNGKKINIHER